MEFQRYAAFYTPPPGPLADFGASWLGWDIATGLPLPHPIVHGLKEDIAPLTQAPRKYGLHGTLKPPFRLAEGRSLGQLIRALDSVCRTLAPVSCGGLTLHQLGRFLALTPQGETRPLSDLASAIVEQLDAFRAPPTELELAKRRQTGLSERQETYLMQWGYPYVMEEFRFHLTLTGKLKKTQVQHVRDALAPILTQILPSRFQVSDLTLAGEDQNGRFHEIQRFSLSA